MVKLLNIPVEIQCNTIAYLDQEPRTLGVSAPFLLLFLPEQKVQMGIWESGDRLSLPYPLSGEHLRSEFDWQNITLQTCGGSESN